MKQIATFVASTFLCSCVTVSLVGQSDIDQESIEDLTIGDVRTAIDGDSFVLRSVHAEYTRTITVPPDQPRRGVALGESAHTFTYSDGRFRWSEGNDDSFESWVYDGENSILVETRDDETQFAGL